MGNEPFAVILADDLCDYDESTVMSQMVKIYEEYKCSIVAIEEVPINQTNKYGIISGDYLDNKKEIIKISNMIEKPDIKDAPSNLAIIGRYILTPDIFDILRNQKAGTGDEIQLSDAINSQAINGAVEAVTLSGSRFDCGSVQGYLDAIFYVANHK